MGSRRIVLAVFILFLSAPSWAVDGVVLINQTAVTKGGVTPADTPGFPVTINARGSYRLSGNLTVSGAGSQDVTAINITANDVTIDLNGFSIRGPAICSGTPPDTVVECTPIGSGVGIDSPGGRNITVINGTICGMCNHGINLGNAARVERVTVRSNGRVGILVGNNSVVSGSTVEFNRLDGIIASSAVTVTGSMVNSNLSGISADSGVVNNSTVNSQRSDGIRMNEGTVTGNTANSNGGNGIRIDNGTVIGNTANSNGIFGISNVGTASNNTASFNDDDGMLASGVVTGNTANSNGGSGINATGVVTGNAAFSNTGFGLDLGVSVGYSNNVLLSNNGGDSNAQVAFGIQMGTNICGGDTTCP
jgi:hypothetical protein